VARKERPTEARCAAAISLRDERFDPQYRRFGVQAALGKTAHISVE
jgi:hypothetical protein